MLAILLCFALFAVLAGASTVHVQYPLQDQLPLIARINEAYSWSFSRDTFISSHNLTLEYTASPLPVWLSFDNGTLTFEGTPSPSDEGSPEILVTATDPQSLDSASSYATLCVTPSAPPQLHVPVMAQFYAANPSLSSVFLLSQNSALNASEPALRIPPSWSFSVGFLYDTFTSDGDVYYAARRVDGSPLPDWIDFNSEMLTFDGVTPTLQNSSGPITVSVALHASDQEGYTAASVPFDIIVAAHELSMSTSSLPTINVTASAPFNFSLTSPDDFFGVLLDGQPIQPSEITSLEIDTSACKGWLKYDSSSRTLSGMAPNDVDSSANPPVLPVTLAVSINQSINTNVSLAIVPSFFSTATLQPLLVLPGNRLDFDLMQYFSNSTGLGAQRSDTNLTAAFDPESSGSYLSLDPIAAQLTGSIPSNITSEYNHVTVTFTAYSRVTHSTSHTSLPISLSNSDFAHQKTGGLSAAARAKLLLGVKIGFGIITGIISLAFSLALLRRWARLKDTAILGEEGTHAWTAEEKKWYGIGIEVEGKITEGPKRESHEGGDPESMPEKVARTPSVRGSAGLGVALHRVLTRSMSNPGCILSPRSPQSPGFMRKGDFLGRIKATARTVSDKYKGVGDVCRRSINRRRPAISKPTLIMTSDHRVSAMTGVPIEGLPFSTNGFGPSPRMPSTSVPFGDVNFSHYAPSGISSIAGSPSSSTGGRSIPRRRADFAPPKGSLKAPPQAHGVPQQPNRHSVDSVGSALSSFSNVSSRTHEVEAVVQTATRATSVRSGFSATSHLDNTKAPEIGRPRLVPFTSANRVPVPKLPSNVLSGDLDAPVNGAVETVNGGAKTKRVASQVAKVFRNVAGRQPAADRTGKTIGGLSSQVHSVRTLGNNTQSARSLGRSPTGSFSIESSQHGHEQGFGSNGKIPIVPRMLARTGEQFKFRVPVSYNAGSPLTSDGTIQRKPKLLDVRLISGKPLPAFVKSDLNTVTSGTSARVEKRVVEFWGIPTSQDTGELNVGIYEQQSDRCVGRVIIQIVERSS